MNGADHLVLISSTRVNCEHGQMASRKPEGVNGQPCQEEYDSQKRRRHHRRPDGGGGLCCSRKVSVAVRCGVDGRVN